MDTVLHKGTNCYFADPNQECYDSHNSDCADDFGKSFGLRHMDCADEFGYSSFGCDELAQEGRSAGANDKRNTQRCRSNKCPSKKAKPRQSMIFKQPVYIIGSGTVVGAKEGEGPLGKYFDTVAEDDKMGEKSFERAEVKMLESSVISAIKNSGRKIDEIDLLLSGDLLNQITSSSFVARDLGIPFVGIYCACSTMTSSLALGASLISAGYHQNIACATASHFATAERQYRYPLEYGCQRPPYAQWTVTGAACSVLSNSGDGPRVTMATLGKVADYGINDLNNMGAAMAPAAMDTMLALFKENGLSEKDFDLILTGDLGKLGSDILRDLMRERGYELGKKYIDCGCMIYGAEQHCYQGGSGAACSATVFNSYVLEKMKQGEYRRIAYFATGALMSPLTSNQGETIPCVSHAVIVEG